MARPKKDYLDYYPLDVDLLSNPKMMMALNDAGPDAAAVYVAALCAVYSKSYWLPHDAGELKVLPAKLHMSVERFDYSYDALVARGLLAEVPAESDVEKRLCPCGMAVTSRGMQEQYFAIKPRVFSEKLPFLLWKPPESEQNGGF